MTNDIQESDGKPNEGYINPGYIPDQKSASETSYYKSNLDEKGIDKEKEERSNEIQSSPQKDSQLWRDLLGFWLLGVCVNYGYVVMLSAAHDIIGTFVEGPEDFNRIMIVENGRGCQMFSTGAILLADVIPNLVVKFLAPFLPFLVNLRVILAVILTAAGFLLVGYAEYQWMALLGVVCTSLASGLGETTMLGYSSRFNRNVVSTWSSGTGGAGIGGSLSYAALRAAGVSLLNTMLIMLIVPVIQSIAFWIILRKPKYTSLVNLSTEKAIDTIQKPKASKDEESTQPDDISNDNEKPLITLKDKLLFVVHLAPYMIPILTVYLASYFINQGLYELVYFENSTMDEPTQYRWLNVVYQIAVFISKSTVNLVTIEKIWIFPIFQSINVVYFLIEAIYYVTPNIWIVFAIAFWEGLVGGATYVNTYFKISKNIPMARRRFALSWATIADSIGITLAGFLAIPVHNAICQIPAPHRFKIE